MFDHCGGDSFLMGSELEVRKAKKKKKKKKKNNVSPLSGVK